MEKSDLKKRNPEKIIGAVLLLIPVLSVLMFLFSALDGDFDFTDLDDLSSSWTGSGASMSAAPIYIGLMAVAGSILFKGTGKN